jgi:nucleotide-binding universal stress UspA family protein
VEIRKIVIATDGSAASTAALDFGIELARDRGAEAVALHVAPARELEQLFSPDRTDPPSQAELAEACEALAQAARFGKAQGVTVILELVGADGTDAVADAIVGVASGRDADAVVLGSRGHGRIASAVLGSVSTSAASGSTRSRAASRRC